MMAQLYFCTVCRFTCEEDDVAVKGFANHCVCLGCYQRLTDTKLPMSKSLRRDVEDALRSDP